jgi:hypothetical protein
MKHTPIRHACITATLAFACLILNPLCRGETDLQTALQEHITKALGKGWVASPNGADLRFRPKTMFIYLDDLQKHFEGKGVEKGWVPFSSGLSIYPDEYVPIQREKVTLFSGNTEGLSKLGFLASVQKVLAQIGLTASLKAELSNNWAIKIEIEDAEKEWLWQDDMRLAQETTMRNAERLAEVVKKRYGKVPPALVVIGALRVRGLAAVVESKRTVSAELSVELTQYLAKLGLSWNQEKKRYESLKINDWQYIAFQGQRTAEGVLTISSNDKADLTASDSFVPPEVYVP